MSPIDASEEFERLMNLIGRINYSWTNTESVLIHLIAGLAHTDTETALILFLTLNTTRARVDLVERLSKMARTPAEQRDAILPLTRSVVKLSALRNHYNHSIYAFDQETGAAAPSRCGSPTARPTSRSANRKTSTRMPSPRSRPRSRPSRRSTTGSGK